MSIPIHHLFARSDRVRADVWLNGFPVVELLPVGSVKSQAPPINPLLVGEGNELRVTLSPMPEPQDFALAELAVYLRKFGVDETWADPEAGEAVVDVGIDEALREQARNEEASLPLSLCAVRFNSTGPSFRATLLEADPIGDRDAVMEYALRLRDIFAAKDALAVAEQLAPKIRDFAVAYDTTEAQLHQELQAYLADDIFSRGVISDFEADEISLVPCCDGRMWHLRRKPKPADPRHPEGVGSKPSEWDPFMRTHRDEQGLDCILEVFVGVIDGELRIVR